MRTSAVQNQNLMSECLLLSTFLRGKKVGLDPNAFTDARIRLLYLKSRRMWGMGHSVTSRGLWGSLSASEREGVGKEFYAKVCSLSATITKSQVPGIVKAVTDRYASRKLKDHFRKADIIADRSPQKALEYITREVADIESRMDVGEGKIVRGSDIVKSVIEKIEDPTEEARFATGLKGLDSILGGGIPVGKIGLILADTGVGKTIFALHYALEAAKAGHTVFYAPTELTPLEIAFRAISSLSGVPLSRLTTTERQNLTHEEWTKIYEAGGDFSQMDFNICEERNLDVFELEKQIKVCNAKQAEEGRGPIGLVFVDHFQRLKTPAAWRGRPAPEVNKDTGSKLKDIAVALDVAILVTSQVSSEVSKRDNTLPGMRESYGSSAVAFECDVVFCLDRPDNKAAATEEAEKERANKRLDRYLVAIPKSRFGRSKLVYGCFLCMETLKLFPAAKNSDLVAA